MNNNLKKTVSKNIDDRDRNTIQIIEVTQAQASSLSHLPKDQFLYIKDEILPLIPNLESTATLADVINKVNTVIDALNGWVLRKVE